jgi:hypothetical protein
MADKDKDDQASREPYIGQADRPEVRISPDAPIGELRVRDLVAILGLGTGKDFVDGKDWQKDSFDGGIKWWDKKDKDWKDKPEKFEKNEKIEKPEKPEIKELKLEKIESDGVFDPRRPPRPDPRLDQVMRALAGLTEKVSQLADQVEELKKRKG